MCDIIKFPAATDVDECDIFDFPGSVPADSFPCFEILSISQGRALTEAHVPEDIAEAMVKAVKASPEFCSFEIYKRDKRTAWIDGNVPTAVAMRLATMLAA